MGNPSKYVHDLVIDYDLSSLYPSIIRAFNIASSSQYGRLIIKTDGEHNYGNIEGRDLGGELLDDLSSMDFCNIAIKHHGLSKTEDYLLELERMGY